MPTIRPLALAGVFTLLVLVGVAFSDGSDEPVSCDAFDPSTATVSFVNDVQMVFDFNCVACHQTGAENAELNLEWGIAYGELVGVDSSEGDLPRITPGDVEASYLMHKLRGTHLEVGGSGSIMPLGLGALPEREIAVVETWVRECALDN